MADRAADRIVRYTRTPGGATKAIETDLNAEQALTELGGDWERAKDEIDLLSAIGADHDQKTFEAHESTPVLFGAALSNFGVGRLLDAMVDIAPAPAPRPDVDDDPRPLEEPFSGLVFKVQANMDPSHRDRIAFVRVCSGRFERGMVLVHAATARPFATKYAQSVFGQERATIDEAYPGDVVGLVNASALRPGDTLYDGSPVEFPKIPSFAPEHFSTARVRDSSRSKQFRKGIEQLDAEGVVQVLRSDVRGDQSPVLAAVGDAVRRGQAPDGHRVQHRDPDGPARLRHRQAHRRRVGADPGPPAWGGGLRPLAGRGLLALFTDEWRMRGVMRDHPDLVLNALLADTRG